MTPEVVALLALVDKIGALPLGGVLVAVVIGPWVMSFILAKGQEKRFEAVVKMLEDHRELTQDFKDLCDVQSDRETALRQIIESNTRALTRLTDFVEARRNGNGYAA